jgi:glucose-6-phosphate 1-dehydrogenase
MAGERLELVVQQTHADEMKPYERLLGDALRGDPRYSSVKTAWKPLGALWIRLWEARHRSMTTIRTPGGRQRLTALLLMMAAQSQADRGQSDASDKMKVASEDAMWLSWAARNDRRAD